MLAKAQGKPGERSRGRRAVADTLRCELSVEQPKGSCGGSREQTPESGPCAGSHQRGWEPGLPPPQQGPGPGTHGAEGSGTFREGVGVILARRGSWACGERKEAYSL